MINYFNNKLYEIYYSLKGLLRPFYIILIFISIILPIFIYCIINLGLKIFSFITLFKLIIIFLIVIVNFYILYNEIKIYKSEKNVHEYKQSGFLDGKIGRSLKSIGSIAIGASSAYGTFLTVKSSRDKEQISQEMNKMSTNINELKNEISSLQNLQDFVKSQLQNKSSILSSSIHDARYNLLKANNDNDTYQNLKELSKNLQGNEYQDILQQIETAKKVAEASSAEAKRSLDKISRQSIDLESDFSKLDKSFIGSEWVEWFEKLFESQNAWGQLSISLLFLNYAVIYSLINIIYIFYGDYLIKRFNMEEKYPRLAKIIQLQRKFQNYYFWFSILCIFTVVLIEVVFSIFVLTL